MDKDTFETKLREAKRQKSQVEEELESVSERWRAERRRLNSDIDRLEAELAEAKDVRRKTPGTKTDSTVDPGEIAKIQTAADERVKKAEKDFEADREKLRAEIARLQRAVAELIERSNNPMRSTEPIKEQFQAQLEEAFKAKQQVEEDFHRARLSWEEERLKTAGEIFKLRRNTAPSKVKGKLDDESRVKELERRLEETGKSRDALEKQVAAAKAAQGGEHEKEIRQLNARIQELEEQQRAGSAQAAELQKHEASLKESELRNAEANETNRRLENELQQVRAQLQSAKSNHEAETQQLHRRLAEKNDAVSSDVVDQLRRQYDDKLQEMIREKTQLSEDLHKASAMLDEERSRFSAAAAAPSSQPAVEMSGEVDTSKIAAELARVEQMIAEIASLIDDPDTDLSTVIRKNVERSELDAYLKGLLFSIGRNT